MQVDEKRFNVLIVMHFEYWELFWSQISLLVEVSDALIMVQLSYARIFEQFLDWKNIQFLLPKITYNEALTRWV